MPGLLLGQVEKTSVGIATFAARGLPFSGRPACSLEWSQAAKKNDWKCPRPLEE